MKKKMQMVHAFLRDESGQDLMEYALIAALISLAAVTVMHGLATAIGTAYTSLSSRLAAAW
ncbi:MAG TPA: Flp family type IVb pilin [Acidobacteriaceae bacterium]